MSSLFFSEVFARRRYLFLTNLVITSGKTMPWQDFIDVEFIKLNGKHMSGALVALVGFSLLTWVSGKIMEAGYVLAIIRLADKIVVTCCIIYLAIVILWELARKLVNLFKGSGNGSVPSIFVA